jgi:hypothetical protein
MAFVGPQSDGTLLWRCRLKRHHDWLVRFREVACVCASGTGTAVAQVRMTCRRNRGEHEHHFRTAVDATMSNHPQCIGILGLS